MSLVRYSILVTSLAAATLGLAWAVALRRSAGPTCWAVAYGTGLALVNTLVAHGLVLWSARRSTNAFLGAVLGGMVGRMALLLAAVVAGILGLGLPRLPLATSLLSYFVLFLIMELSILHRSGGARAPSGPQEAAR